MITEIRPDLDRDTQNRFGTAADDAHVMPGTAALGGELAPGRTTVVFVDEVLGF